MLTRVFAKNQNIWSCESENPLFIKPKRPVVAAKEGLIKKLIKPC